MSRCYDDGMAALEALRRQNRSLVEKLTRHNETLQQMKISLPSLLLHASAREPSTGTTGTTGPAERTGGVSPDRESQTPDEEFAGVTSETDQHEVGRHVSLLLDRRNPTTGPEPLTPHARQIGDDSTSMETDATSQGQQIRPLLGYDWIAGLLDTESSVTERPPQFFSELNSFRQLNSDKCIHSAASGPELVADLESPGFERESQKPPDQHQCVFCYRINTRLFASPLDPHAACPVCRTPRNETEPAFIRVSIPRSALVPSYQHKAHRRSSFDPSDSLGLPSHCLSGWSSSSPDSGCQMSRLDLRGSLQKRDSSVSKEWRHQGSDLLLNGSRLPRFHFQHLEQKMSEAHY